jgi:hypothetical protein
LTMGIQVARARCRSNRGEDQRHACRLISMSPLLLLLPTLWLLAASFVVLLCRGAARADQQMLAADGRERAAAGGARITRQAGGEGLGRTASANRDGVLAHHAQGRAPLGARVRAGAVRARGARCAAER